MNKKINHLVYYLYMLFLILFTLLIGLAYYFIHYRPIFLIVAFCILAVALIVESVSLRRKKDSGDLKSQTWELLGDFMVEDSITISDKINLSENKTIQFIPRGTYSVYLEKFSIAGEHYIASIRIIGMDKWINPKSEDIEITIDTGFMIFVGVGIKSELVVEIEKKQLQIISGNNHKLDAELLKLDGKNIGFVTVTGLGDDQYLLIIRPTHDNRLEIICRFISSIEECL